MSHERIDVSIVIPVFKRYEDLRRCLDSLAELTGHAFEIIVVDDHSDDSTATMVRAEFPKVIFRENLTNLGPAYARNVGVNLARGEYILFLDSDTVAGNDKLLTDFIEFFRTHHDAGTVGGEIRSYSGWSEEVYGCMITGKGKTQSITVPKFKGAFAECDYLATCCCMVRADLARRIGGFDPYYQFGAEDKDFGYRIQKLGYRNYVAVDCAIVHLHSPRGRNTDETYRYHFTRIRFIFKHFSPLRILSVVVSLLVSVLVFHILLLPKLLFLLVCRRKIVKEHVTGGYLLVKALLFCCLSFRESRESNSRNFLEPVEIERFLAWHAGKVSL